MEFSRLKRCWSRVKLPSAAGQGPWIFHTLPVPITQPLGIWQQVVLIMAEPSCGSSCSGSAPLALEWRPAARALLSCSSLLPCKAWEPSASPGFPINPAPPLSSWPGRLFLWHLYNFKAKWCDALSLTSAPPARTKSTPPLQRSTSQPWNLYSLPSFPF